MNTTLDYVIAFSFIAIISVVAALALAANTKALNEDKAIRAEIADIQRELEAIGPYPTAAQANAVYARVRRLEARQKKFLSSPFVVKR